MSRTATRTIPQDVLNVLARGEVRDGVFFLPPGHLDRKLYSATNDVLEALGGKWIRSRKGHVFETDPGDRIAAAVATGSYDDQNLLAFFPTPAWLAKDLVERAGVQPCDECLEPSAGEGAIAKALVAATAPECVTCVEIDERRAEKLEQVLGDAVCILHVDFLGMAPPRDPTEGGFDHIVMNPPFSVPGMPRADIDHVLHALRFLRSDGKLVSVMSAGTMFRTDKKTLAFLELVDRRGGAIEMLPDDSFQESGTSVLTCVVEIPGGEA